MTKTTTSGLHSLGFSQSRISPRVKGAGVEVGRRRPEGICEYGVAVEVDVDVRRVAHPRHVLPLAAGDGRRGAPRRVVEVCAAGTYS